MILFSILIYCLAVILISFWKRRVSSGDDYLMAGRSANALLITASIFTLIGGGELVTLTALAFVYGAGGLSLFVGYALGFIFLGIVAPKLRHNIDDHLYLSLPDYVHQRFGRTAGYMVFAISFLAFFALLLIQFIAGGQVLSPTIGLNYTQSVLLVAGVTFTYLLIGGFRAVITTDFFQGLAMLILMPLLTYLAFSTVTTDVFSIRAEVLPISVWISLTITGFFVAASSADVWQRIYAAKSDKSARYGIFGGAALLLLFGIILVLFGSIVHAAGVTDPDSAFSIGLSSLLPAWAVPLSIILVLSTIMSTIDTEMFLLSGMASREYIRFKNKEIGGTGIAQLESIWHSRILMLAITISALLLALLFDNLIPIYTWLLSAVLVIAPVIMSAIFMDITRKTFVTSVMSNLIIFTTLVTSGTLTPESAYLIVIPGFLVVLFAYLFNGHSKNTSHT